MYKQFCLIFFIFLTINLQLFSQNLESNDNKEQKTRLQFKLSSRRTFVDNKAASLLGVRLGLMFNKKYEIGIGYYSSGFFNLAKTVKDIPKTVINESTGEIKPAMADVGFGYVSLYAEYVILSKKKWTFTVNSQYGRGVALLDVKDTDGNFLEEQRKNKNLIEHSTKVTFALTSWFDLIGGVGYRYLLDRDDVIRDAFTSPIYILSFNIDFFDLHKKLFKKKK